MAILTPKTFDELRELLIALEHGDSSLRLGNATVKTLKNMLSSPANTAISTMSNIAKANDVNPSTLTRMAHTLGYKKFSHLQKIFKDHFEGGTHFYTDKVNKLISGKQDKHIPIFDDIVLRETDNVASLSTNISRHANQEVVNLLIQARKVRFYGRRQFYSLAAFYSYCLGLIREHVDILQDDVHGISHSLNFMDKRDLVVVMGCAPHTKATVDACEIAKSQGIPIVAITDSPTSPLAQYAIQHLIIPTESQFYSNSMAAAFTLAEITLTMVAQQMGKGALETLAKREEMIQEFGISVAISEQFNVDFDP